MYFLYFVSVQIQFMNVWYVKSESNFGRVASWEIKEKKEEWKGKKRESRGEEEDEAKNRNYYYCIVCAQSIIVDICGIAHIKSRRRRLEVKANIGAKTRFHPFVFTTPTGKYKSLPRPILMDKTYSIWKMYQYDEYKWVSEAKWGLVFFSFGNEVLE